MMTENDYHLSMKISRRATVSERSGMRTLLVHRLRLGAKAVLRVPLRQSLASPQYNIYCETCDRWFPCGVGEEFECPSCGGVFVMEFAVFTRVKTGD